MNANKLPHWALTFLRCPRTGAALAVEGTAITTAEGMHVGRIEDGIARFPAASSTDGMRIYRAAGGAHFHERAATAFAMSTLDTPVYHKLLSAFRSPDPDLAVVDVGGGDGRNAQPFLEWGHRRVIVVDAVAEALARFRARIEASHPEWMENLLLIEADARALPLAPGVAERVFSIETLYYLNEAYAEGLRECARLLSPTGKLLISERDYEGGLVMRLIYFGLTGLLESAGSRDLWDGNPADLARSRCFTEAEAIAMVESVGLQVESVAGLPLLSLVLGWLRSQGRLRGDDEARLDQVRALLVTLAESGKMRRCHVVIARRSSLS